MRQRRTCCFKILSNHNDTHLKLEINKIIKIEKVLIPLKILTNSNSYQNVNHIVNQFFIFLYCGAKDSGNLGPFHIKPKAHAGEKEMSENEQKKSELLGDVAEDNFVLDKSKSRKEKAARPQGQFPRASQGKAQVQRDSYERIMEEQF